ncbi:MAG: hypothetical protein ACLQQ4_16035 [Bacteroidia bacterium]
MKINDKIEEVRNLHNQARALKEKARVSDSNINFFEKASNKYLEAADGVFNLLAKNNKIDGSTTIRMKALGFYYRFEQNVCLSAYNYKSDKFQEAIVFAERAKEEIEKALNVINDSLEALNHETKEFLIMMRKNWQSSALSINVYKLEPLAKQAMNSHDFIKAFDYYNEMITVMKQVYEYNKNAPLDQVYIRIAHGNYLAMIASLAQVMAGLTEKNISNSVFSSDMNIDLIRHYVDAYKSSIEAWNANPEWTQYRKDADVIKENIQKLLDTNKDKRNVYLTEFKNDSILQSILLPENKIRDYNNSSAPIRLHKRYKGYEFKLYSLLLNRKYIIGGCKEDIMGLFGIECKNKIQWHKRGKPNEVVFLIVLLSIFTIDDYTKFNSNKIDLDLINEILNKRIEFANTKLPKMRSISSMASAYKRYITGERRDFGKGAKNLPAKRKDLVDIVKETFHQKFAIPFEVKN